MQQPNNKMDKNKLILFSVFIMVIATVTTIFVVLLNRKEEIIYESSEEVLQTDIQQKVYGSGAPQAAKSAIREIKKLESQLSWRHSSSQIQNINKNAGGQWVNLSSGIIDILLKSQDIASSSNGAFDPTILPISSVWNLTANNGTPPSREEILKRLPLVDYKSLKINKDLKKAKLLKPDSGLDLDGIFKGAACNFALRQYKENGPYAGMISINSTSGHSVGILGKKRNNQLWKIAISTPSYKSDSESTSIFGILAATEGHIFTSGSLEHPPSLNKKLPYDILEPRIGYPSENDLICVTVIHPDGVIANALALACRILGRESSISLLDHYSAGAIFADNQKHVFLTDDIKGKFTLKDPTFTLIDE